VLLTTLLAALGAARLWQGARPRLAHLMVAAALMSVGLLAHYEGVFALIPVAVLVIATWQRERASWQTWALQLLPPLALGAVVVGSFYIPFVLHPAFGDTAVYLGEKRVGGALLYNNIADFFQRVGFYNPALYPATLGAVVLVGATVWAWRAHAAKGLAWRVGMGALVALGLTIIAFPSAWLVGGVNLSALVFVAWMALLWFARGSTPLKALLAWFGASALFYFFLMLKVHTHYYVTLPPWSVLLGLVLASGWGTLRRRWLRWGALGLGLLALGLTGTYVWLAMVRHTIEFKHNYPQAKPALYWTPFGATAPRGGYFGFPYRTAWKAVGGMFANGTLRGTYDSNQEDLITNWYTRGAMRCPNSDLFIIARNVEDPHAIIPDVIEGLYKPEIEITRGGAPQVWVYRRGYDGPLRQVRYEDYAPTFDRELSAPVFRVGAPLDEVFEPSQRVDARLGENFRLVGYDLSARRAAPGDELLLTLYWETLAPTPAGYHVFAHLGDGDLAAHADGAPRCGQHPTWRWKAGERVVDRYILAVSEAGPEGVLPLRVGMYEYIGGQRLRVTDPLGQDLGSSLLLTEVRVGTPSFDAPAPQVAVDVTLGDTVRLWGYDMPQAEIAPGEPLRLTVYWHCLAPMTANYTVFAHLIGPEGLPYGQNDAMPRGGALPTQHWVMGEGVSDVIEIHVKEDTPAGDYQIMLGMYDAATLTRLPARLAGQPLPNDQFPIEGLTVAAHE
jgi:4-amino-4-deoxy-L-arabinose transferase-like glycosyltransferase